MSAKKLRIALAGNPNSGKTTLFNALTGSNQFVGNWPGVTVEKKSGKLKGHTDVEIVDLPGIYSLSPYTPEEVIARNYLIGEDVGAVINIVDGTNLERNLYLSTQLRELGVPMVLAINMHDLVQKNGDKIDAALLGERLGCDVYFISAMKNEGLQELTDAAIALAQKPAKPSNLRFGEDFEQHIQELEKLIPESTELSPIRRRWYAIKLLEKDEKIRELLGLDESKWQPYQQKIEALEAKVDDDTESYISSARYEWIEQAIKGSYVKQKKGQLTTSDKIDRVVTNRWLALPIFALVMFVVYYIAVSSVGKVATDWANDGVFGDGWHLFGIGTHAYEDAAEEAVEPLLIKSSFEEAAEKAGVDPAEAKDLTTTAELRDEESGELQKTLQVDYNAYMEVKDVEEPDPADYGVWVPGVPKLIEAGLDKLNVTGWLHDLVLDGIVAGVGAVLGFVPQIFILFLLLAFLETCGYMARVAFVMDRIFRKFGLSGRSFIPMMVSSGCGVPGIMATRTIENQRDRRLTAIITTFMPCGAKVPVIALIAGALFNGAWWVAPSAYFLGIASIIISGIILKKFKAFAGEVAPFVMELPAYHWPRVTTILHSMWERGWSFIKKAGTIILLATIFVWLASTYGWENGQWGAVESQDNSILGRIGQAVAFIFIPLGFGEWRAVVATITGLIAKENVVGTVGVLYGGMDEVAENGWQIWTAMAQSFTAVSAYSFLAFNLLCAPCFAAIGALRREMNNGRWTAFALVFQTIYAYAIALIIYQLGSLFTGHVHPVGLVVALIALGLLIYGLVRPENSQKRLRAERLAKLERS